MCNVCHGTGYIDAHWDKAVKQDPKAKVRLPCPKCNPYGKTQVVLFPFIPTLQDVMKPYGVGLTGKL